MELCRCGRMEFVELNAVPKVLELVALAHNLKELEKAVAKNEFPSL